MYSKISNNKEEYFFIEALRVMVILYSFIHSLTGNGIILGQLVLILSLDFLFIDKGMLALDDTQSAAKQG